MITAWRKSSHSGSTTDEACVELAGLVEGVGVRDSKDPDGGRLAVSGAGFAGLVGRIKRGVLDLP
ncbi:MULTISPECIES: DUF397 domain-containing protein [Thermomonosporaceae]|uniref:DUF397 domain-containing protein n=1 Tax=Thermomonosporaceae TaxID=2012 RepID=UPI00255A9B3B|nr:MULTISPECIES: DUF397 domain-containing protein [Thermomonosporaceae]MDL4775618.1 DUF397 domain-containing protein [Actinomadura xylanilytica]